MKKSSVYSLTLILALLASLVVGVVPSQRVHATPKEGGCWYYRENMPTARFGLAAVELDGEIYVLGGRNDAATRYDVVEKYDPLTDSWTTVAPMPTERTWLVAAVATPADGKPKIYAIGGNAGGDKLGTVEEYDPDTDTWTTKASMNVPRDDAVAGVVDNEIYVMGGWRDFALDDVEVFDPVAGSWATKADMPYAVAMASAAVVDSKIYVIGGFDGTGALPTVYEYDPNADSGAGTWTKKADLPVARSQLAAVALGGKIYVFGGYNNSLVPAIRADVHVYTPGPGDGGGSWDVLNDMPTQRTAVAAAAANDGSKDMVYVFGGERSWNGAGVDYNEAVDFNCTNNPPEVPSSPDPFNFATDQALDTGVSWSASDLDVGDTLTYDVYFGEDVAPGTGANPTTPPLVSSAQSDSSYDPLGTLKPNTTYFWYIVARDSADAVTSGPRWSFATGGGPYIEVEKTADPPILGEGPGTVQFNVQVANPLTDTVTLTGMEDDVYGDLNGQGDCAVPQELAGSGAVYACTFSGAVNGNSGDVLKDTVTVTATDGLGGFAVGVASATVAITDTVPTVFLIKSAAPESLPEPGGTVEFNVQVSNTSSETLTFDSLEDDVFGDLEDRGCTLPADIAAGERYECSFSADITGNAGVTHTDTVTATLQDEELNLAHGSDDATVEITDVLPSATVLKTAGPTSVAEPGGTITFTVVVTNTSVETITLATLVDSAYGNLDGQGDCSLPQDALAPEIAYSCTFTGTVSGVGGVTHTNTVTATILDDEENIVQLSGSADVDIEDVYPLYLPFVARGLSWKTAFALRPGRVLGDIIGVILSTLRTGAVALRSF